MSIPKVEDIKRPLVLGEILMVPCVYRENWVPYEYTEQDVWRDTKDIPNFVKKIWITPVIPHLHSDIENGQDFPHYHADFRFIKTTTDILTGEETAIPEYHENHTWGHYVRAFPDLYKYKDEGLVYFALPVVSLQHKVITGVKLISKSKIKHKCIHKGKCPHRGYDLSQERAVDGVITCPLHGLKFNEKTKELLNDPTT